MRPCRLVLESIRDLVHIRLPGHRGLVSRVAEQDGDLLVLRAPLADSGIVIPEPAQALDVGLVAPDGIAWFSAVVLAVAPGERPLMHVRVLRRSVARDRRSSPRAPERLAVALNRSGTPVAATLVDVSDGGLRVESSEALSVGELLQVAIEIPGDEPLRATARVAHALGGLCFELAPAPARSRLVRGAFHRLALPEATNDSSARKVRPG